MQQWEIKHRYTGSVLYAGGGETLRDVVVAAVRCGADLRGAYLSDAYLRGANLSDADLRGANMRGAYLRCANLRCANLSGAYLSDADLRGANLRCANLSGADLRDADLRDADLSGADLRGAYLSDAYLRGANLSDADLRGANLRGAKLVGDRPVLMIGPVGSRSDYLTAYVTDAGVRVRAGCFFGSLDAFRAAVVETHGDSNHGREYAAAISMIESHAAIWTPAVETAKEGE